MLFIITIAALIIGTVIGICLHRFHQNGWIPSKYLEHEKAEEGTHGRKLNHNTSPHLPSRHHKGRRVYKAFAF